MSRRDDYWDLSERERSELTEEQVRGFEAYECMKHGIVRLPAPEPPSEKPAVHYTTVFGVSKHDGYSVTAVFATREAAERALPEALFTEQDYKLGIKIAKAAVEISPLQVVLEADLVGHREALLSYKESEERHTKAKSEYQAAEELYSRKVGDMWRDWHECKQKALAVETVRRTFNEYKGLAGNDNLARTFLAKAFSPEQLNDAAEWFSSTEFTDFEDEIDSSDNVIAAAAEVHA